METRKNLKIEGTIVEKKKNVQEESGNDLNHSRGKRSIGCDRKLNYVVTVFFKWKPPPVMTGRSTITSRDL